MERRKKHALLNRSGRKKKVTVVSVGLVFLSVRGVLCYDATMLSMHANAQYVPMYDRIQ